MTTVLFIAGIAGLILGGIIAWLLASSSLQRLQGRAESAEAVNSELRQQILQKDTELSKIRTDLTEEKQARASMDAKYQEAEKNLRTIETWITDKLGSISLDALSKNSAEFLKLAEEKLKSQTVEGEKELEGKKYLIDKSVETIAKTLSEMQQKLTEVEKSSVKISTLVEHHADITSKLNDTTEHLKHALASSKKRGEWGSAWQKIFSVWQGW